MKTIEKNLGQSEKRKFKTTIPKNKKGLSILQDIDTLIEDLKSNNLLGIFQDFDSDPEDYEFRGTPVHSTAKASPNGEIHLGMAMGQYINEDYNVIGNDFGRETETAREISASLSKSFVLESPLSDTRRYIFRSALEIPLWHQFQVRNEDIYLGGNRVRITPKGEILVEAKMELFVNGESVREKKGTLLSFKKYEDFTSEYIFNHKLKLAFAEDVENNSNITVRVTVTVSMKDESHDTDNTDQHLDQLNFLYMAVQYFDQNFIDNPDYEDIKYYHFTNGKLGAANTSIKLEYISVEDFTIARSINVPAIAENMIMSS